jgi:hypothetical protein
MRRSIHLGHGCIGVISENFSVLWSLKFVEQLSAKHYIEVLFDPSHNFINSILPGEETKICVFKILPFSPRRSKDMKVSNQRLS